MPTDYTQYDSSCAQLFNSSTLHVHVRINIFLQVSVPHRVPLYLDQHKRELLAESSLEYMNLHVRTIIRHKKRTKQL